MGAQGSVTFLSCTPGGDVSVSPGETQQFSAIVANDSPDMVSGDVAWAIGGVEVASEPFSLDPDRQITLSASRTFDEIVSVTGEGTFAVTVEAFLD